MAKIPARLEVNCFNEASQELREGCLAEDDPAMHWAEQSTPLLGRRRRRNFSESEEECESLQINKGCMSQKRAKLNAQDPESRRESAAESKTTQAECST